MRRAVFVLVATMMSVATAVAQDKETERLAEAATVMKEILSIPEGIPQDLLDKSECVIVFPSVVKAAIGTVVRAATVMIAARAATVVIAATAATAAPAATASRAMRAPSLRSHRRSSRGMTTTNSSPIPRTGNPAKRTPRSNPGPSSFHLDGRAAVGRSGPTGVSHA